MMQRHSANHAPLLCLWAMLGVLLLQLLLGAQQDDGGMSAKLRTLNSKMNSLHVDSDIQHHLSEARAEEHARLQAQLDELGRILREAMPMMKRQTPAGPPF